MKFALHFKNCGEGEFIEDFLLLIRQMLESHGLEVMYEFDSSLPRCHIIAELFEDTDHERLRASKQHGSEWVILATEYVTGHTFNSFPNLHDAEQYADRAHWQQRYVNFVRCAEHARAVWLAMDMPEQTAAYRAIVPPHVPVIPLPFPFCPRLLPTDPPRAKDIDVMFSGTRTAHRMAIMQALSSRARFFGTRYIPDYLRRELLARTRICLAMRQGPDWPYPSPLRYWGLIHRAAFVLAEQCPFLCRLDRYVVQAPSESYAQVVLGLLQQPDACEQVRRDLLTRYADEYPCAPAARELLERTFANPR
jgi:hypothetical protein